MGPAGRPVAHVLDVYMRFHGAILFVKDLPAMAAFYTGAIGLSEQSRTESWIEYDGLALHAIPPHIAAGIDISQLREDYPVKFVFEAADPEAEGARLAGAGVTVISRPWGGHDYADPEGNIFSIIAGAASASDSNGRT